MKKKVGRKERGGGGKQGRYKGMKSKETMNAKERKGEGGWKGEGSRLK